MSDLRQYIEKRKAKDIDFAANYEEGFENFRIGLILKQARESSGMTQEELAAKMKTTKSVISRIENHSDDIKLSTLTKAARALGKNLTINLF